jgi:hypothetical protein
MSVTGGHHMNDDNELSEVRESLNAEGADLAGVHLDRPAEAVIARGQALRLRRRVLRGLSGVTAASAAMAVALTLSLGGTGLRQVHVNDTDWSVNTNPDGTVVLQVRRPGDSLRLQSVLVRAGIPATVRWNESCAVSVWTRASGKFVALHPVASPLPRQRVTPGWFRLSIRPALIPAHSRFVLSSRPVPAARLPYHRFPQARHRLPVIVAIVPASAPLACTGGSHARIGLYPACGTSPSAAPRPGGTPSPSRTPRSRATPSPDPTPSLHATPGPDPAPRPDATPTPHATPSAAPSPGGACPPGPHPARTRHWSAG